jgi:hypothetical protein
MVFWYSGFVVFWSGQVDSQFQQNKSKQSNPDWSLRLLVTTLMLNGQDLFICLYFWLEPPDATIGASPMLDRGRQKYQKFPAHLAGQARL